MAESFSFEEASKPIASGPESFSFEEAFTPNVTSNVPKQKIETTMLGSAAASGAEAALAMPAVLAGAGAGARVGGLAGVALGAVFPPIAPVSGIIGTIGGGITGAIAAGMLAEKGIHTIEGAVDQNFGTDIVKTRMAQQQQRPYASAFGQLVGGGLGPGSTFGLAKEAINIGGRQVGRAGQAAIGAGAMTGIGATQRALTGGDPFDPVLMAADVAGGGLTRPTKLGEKFINFGGKIIPGRTAPTPEGIRPPTDSTETINPLTPKEPPTPKEVETKKNEDSLIREFELGTNPNKQLDQAAFMDTKTGEYIKQGARHDELLKKNPDLVAGFLLKDGTFVTRKEAAVIAKDQHADKLVEEIDPKQGLRSSNFGPERLDALKPKDLIFYKDKLKELIYEKRSLEELLDQDRSWDVEIESIKRQEKRIAKLQEQINETQKLHDSLEQGTETPKSNSKKIDFDAPSGVKINKEDVGLTRGLAPEKLRAFDSLVAGTIIQHGHILSANKDTGVIVVDAGGGAILTIDKYGYGDITGGWSDKYKGTPNEKWYSSLNFNRSSEGAAFLALQTIEKVKKQILTGEIYPQKLNSFSKNTKSAVQKEDDLFLKYQQVKQQHEDALAFPDKYSKEQVEALNQQRLSVRDELLTAKLATIENPVLREMALKAGADDVALHNLGTSNVGTLVSYLKGKFGDNHYISQMLDALNVDPNTRLFVVSQAEFKSAAQELGMSPNSPALWNSSIGIIIEKGRGTNALVAAHEIGHAALASKIEQIRALPADHPDAVRLKKLVSNIEDILADAKSKIDLDKLSTSSRSKLEYALSDVHEFISDGIFQPTVMQELLAISRANPKLGFVDKILKAVSDFFGLDSKQYTALHDLIESVGKLAEADIPKDLDPPNLFTKGMKESDDIQKDLGKEGIAATHDSPHRFSGDFDWIQNVGKGQGAAAKGVGTYLSSGDDVHHNYKKEFTDTIEKQRADAEGYKLKFSFFDTQTITKTKDYFAFKVWRTIKEHEDLFNYAKNRKNTREDAIASVKQDLKDLIKISDYHDSDVELRAYYDKQLQEINKKRWTKAYEYVRPKAPGFEGDVSPTYHVTINANPDHIMSWDKPIKEQSEYVQQKLNSFIDPDSYAPIKWEKGADREVLGYPNRKGKTLKTYVRGVKEPVEIAQVGFDGAVDDARTYMIKIPLSLRDKYYNTGEVFGSVKEAQAEFAAMHKESFGSAATPETTVGQLYNSMVRDFEATAKREGKGDISEREAQIKTTLQLLNKGIVGHRFNSAGGQNAKYPNYVIFKDSVIKTNAVTFKDKPRELASRGASPESASIDPRRYDPRRVTDEADLKLKGKELYASKGEAAAREFLQGYEKYKLDWVDPVKFVEDAVDINLNNQMAIRRNVTNNAERLKEMVPDPVTREQIAIIIDDGRIGVLGGPAKALADKYTSDMKDIGERALKEGVVKGLLTDYVTHIVNWADMPKGALDTFLSEVFKRAGDPTKRTTTESRFGMERKIETFTQLERVLADINKRIAKTGEDFRLEIKTKDIAEIYKQYGLSMEKAIENKKLVESVLTARNPAGESLIRRVTDEAPLPRGWEVLNDRQFAGYAVHPDLAPALKFAFENKTGTILNGLYTVSQAVKRLNVIASFFHAKSLLEVQSSTGIPLVTPLKEVGLGIVDKVQGTEVSGIRKAVEQFKKGGLGDSVDKWIRGGLVLEIPQDVKIGVLGSIGKFADSMIGKYGPKTHILESALTTTEKYTLGITDKVTWDYLHTGGKLYVADKYLERARIDAGKKGVPFDETASRKEITSFVNKAFGGLNWFQEARSVQNEFGKRMAMAAYSPEGRKYLQLLLFAPDWTISTIKAFTAALPKDLNPLKMKPIEGIKGMATPSTQADYARLYQFKTALTYLTLLNGINLLTADKPIWENKDPTRIEFADGTSMQAMKHAMEPYHWLADPAKTLTNKLGFLPKAAIVATTGLEYPSPYAPKMVDPSAANRAKAIASMALPFQVSAAISAPEGEGLKRALYGTGGIPLYGSTPDQRKAKNKERTKEINEKRKEYREREREAGR